MLPRGPLYKRTTFITRDHECGTIKILRLISNTKTIQSKEYKKHIHSSAANLYNSLDIGSSVAMSRIIIKGLPKYVTESELKSHIYAGLRTANGNDIDNENQLISDIKIARTRSGESRRFAFVGFKNEEDASNAVRYFDGTFMHTARLEVHPAKSFADPDVPLSSRERKRAALARLREREARMLGSENQNPASKDDTKQEQPLRDFVNTMKPEQNILADEETLEKEEESESSGNPLLRQALALQTDDTQEETTPVDNKLAHDEAVSDMEWFKKHSVRIRESTDETKATDSQTPVDEALRNHEKEPIEEQEQEPTSEEKAITQIKSTGRLFLRNILYSSTEDDFRELFSPYGELDEVHIALDTRTGQSKGFAYVMFKNPEDAVQAYIELDKQIFQGRLLHILPAEAKKNHRLDQFDLQNMPLKKQRELKKKAAANKQTFSWNSLFMNQDAILNSVSAKLGIDKTELINPENSNSAVKQALAEAHVIGDVRKYFESKGIDLIKFGELKSSSQRDDRVLLVKNFPYGTTREELGELFVPFGKIDRLLMPPAGTIAILQFRDVTSGRAAFTKLAFKRFKDGIIYLEKGPKDCFKRPADSDDTLEQEIKEQVVEVDERKRTVSSLLETKKNEEGLESEVVENSYDGPTVSVFIKNLNFATTSQALTAKFASFDGFVVAQVKTKPDSKHPGKSLSMGFGFAEFKSKEQANAVIAALDNSILDGHRLQLKLSNRNSAGQSTGRKSAGLKSGKIIIKNLPFEATRNDVFELFNSFGHLKSVRVPKKFDKSSRGFAFVEFLLPKEAEYAVDQLQGVHLLGRRLVMQPAEEEIGDAEIEIERLTKKAKKQQITNQVAALRNSGGRRKLAADTEELASDF